MIKYIFSLLSLFIITACATVNKDAPISEIDILLEGQNHEKRPQMTTVCKGFLVTEKQVADFYNNATRIPEKTFKKKHNILPCYTTGTAYLYGEKYNWIIHSGGIGEFFNDNERFIKICGKKCCEAINRIC